jgi:hypothetical protein
MGRIVEEVMLGGKRINALFDTGSERSYVVKDAMPHMTRCMRIVPRQLGLAGKVHTLRSSCLIQPHINKLPFDMKAHPIDDLGVVDGKEIRLLVGATAIEEWDFILDPKAKKLDLRMVKKKEFIEF